MPNSGAITIKCLKTERIDVYKLIYLTPFWSLMMSTLSHDQDESTLNIWPALVDVIIATLMILLLFMIIQYITFFLSDALKRMEIKSRQDQLVAMITEMEDAGRFPKNSIQWEMSGDQQKLRFSSELLFAPGKATIPEGKSDSFQFLNALGELIHEAYYEKNLFDQIYIEGHTDSTPIRYSDYDSNWELSTARAVYITKYLVEIGALNPIFSNKRFLGVAGYGEYNFILPNTNDTGKAANRRIEILLIYSEKKQFNY